MYSAFQIPAKPTNAPSPNGKVDRRALPVQKASGIQTDAGTVIKDLPTAAVLLLVSITIAAYAFFMIMEAKEEYETAQELL